MESNNTAVFFLFFFLSLALSVHHYLFPSGLEQLSSHLFDAIRICASCGGEKKLQASAVLLFFAAGNTDVWLCKHPALWTDDTAAKPCPVVVVV